MVRPKGVPVMRAIRGLRAFRAASAGSSMYNAAPAHAVRCIIQMPTRIILKGSVL